METSQNIFAIIATEGFGFGERSWFVEAYVDESQAKEVAEKYNNKDDGEIIYSVKSRKLYLK